MNVWDRISNDDSPQAAMRRGRHGFLLGPFTTHAEAVSHVDKARAFAETINDRAIWWCFGTVGLPSEAAAKIKPFFGVNEAGRVFYARREQAES